MLWKCEAQIYKSTEGMENTKGRSLKPFNASFFLLLFRLSHSCVSYVPEAPESVRDQKGNICNRSAPPGRAVLTGRYIVQCTQWGCAENVDKGGSGRQTGGDKNVPPPSLLPAPQPRTASF